MRQKGVKGASPQETHSALEQFEGWIWDVYQAQFDAGLEAVQQFVTTNGHARVPQRATLSSTVQNSLLAVGLRLEEVTIQRANLTPKRSHNWNLSPGWIWKPGKVDTWSRSFEALRDWWTQNDANRVPVTIRHTFRGEEIRIGQWASSQKSKYHAGQLDPEKIRLLESLPGWNGAKTNSNEVLTR